MSESGNLQPGWYYAQGDAPGTQRYWDGTQWVGGPQPVAQAQDAVGSPGSTALTSPPAEFGDRLVGYLIDVGIVIGAGIGLFILALIFGAINDVLGAIVYLLGLLAILGFVIWNRVILQGNTGQSIGKSKANTKLVSDATGEPVGPGMAFVRGIIPVAASFFLSILTFFLLGIGSFLVLIDYLWPLWDPEKKRLTDKILNMSVVKV